MQTLSTIPLSPFLVRKGVGVISGGYPQTPSKGASPLCTPFFQHPSNSLLASGQAQAPLGDDIALHLRGPGGDGAAQAAQVTIVGDTVSAADEQTLRAAGCQVRRLEGNGYAIAAAFEQLLAQVGEG